MVLTSFEVNYVKKGRINVYYGAGKGKSTAAIGKALTDAGNGCNVFVIQFLKGRYTEILKYLKRLEPELKVFSFEKIDRFYEELNDKEKEEEKFNILNGVNFTKKVVSIGECDILVLDEFLGLVDLGIITVNDVLNILKSKPEDMEIIMTGRSMPEELIDAVDYISRIDVVKNSECDE